MRHAIMIMAHADWPMLVRIASLIDHSDIDIVLHINARSSDWDKSLLDGVCKYSRIFHAERVEVSYCNYSQVRAMVSLLECARMHGPYDYYHLISGADLPIHEMPVFLDFFDKNRGKEFVGFSSEYDLDYARRGHYFSNAIRMNRGIVRKSLYRLNKYIIGIQKILGIDYTSGFCGEIKKGSDWWSITDVAAEWLLSHEHEFVKYFKRAYCPSELFAQTLLWNSPLCCNLYNISDENLGSLREIDWTRGRPYIWRKSDYHTLVDSPCLFARKFDSRTDNEIIELISNHVRQ